MASLRHLLENFCQKAIDFYPPVNWNLIINSHYNYHINLRALNLERLKNCRFCPLLLSIFSVLRKFDETVSDKLENDIEDRLTIKAEKLWSFRWSLTTRFIFPLWRLSPQVLRLCLATVAEKCRVHFPNWGHGGGGARESQNCRLRRQKVGQTVNVEEEQTELFRVGLGRDEKRNVVYLGSCTFGHN